MKELINKLITWLKSFKDQVSDIKITDRKNTILDQMLFGLSTEESIEVFNNVVQAFNEELETRKKDAIEEHRIIANHFRDGLK